MLSFSLVFSHSFPNSCKSPYAFVYKVSYSIVLLMDSHMVGQNSNFSSHFLFFFLQHLCKGFFGLLGEFFMN